MSAPSSRLREACWRRPSKRLGQLSRSGIGDMPLVRAYSLARQRATVLLGFAYLSVSILAQRLQGRARQNALTAQAAGSILRKRKTHWLTKSMANFFSFLSYCSGVY